MPIPAQHPLWRSYALCVPQTQAAAIRELAGATRRTDVEGLLDLIHRGPSAPLVVSAIHALQYASEMPVWHELLAQFSSPWSAVRQAAILAIHARLNQAFPAYLIPAIWHGLTRIMAEESSWVVRRHALRAAFDLWRRHPTPDFQRLNRALSDPHWRVRHAFVELLTNPHSGHIPQTIEADDLSHHDQENPSRRATERPPSAVSTLFRDSDLIADEEDRTEDRVPPWVPGPGRPLTPLQCGHCALPDETGNESSDLIDRALAMDLAPLTGRELARVRRAHQFLIWVRNGQDPREDISVVSGLTSDWEPELTGCPWWDWDPSVLARNLDLMSDTSREDCLPLLSQLLRHPEDCVHRRVARILLEMAATEHLVEAARGLDDPREAAIPVIEELFHRLAPRRRRRVADQIFQRPCPSEGQWIFAIRQLDQHEPESFVTACLEQHPPRSSRVHRAWIEFLNRWKSPMAEAWLTNGLLSDDRDIQRTAAESLNRRAGTSPDWWRPYLASPNEHVRAAALGSGLQSGHVEPLKTLAHDPFPAVRIQVARWLVSAASLSTQVAELFLPALQTDTDPGVRAAALTSALAQDLLAAPHRETSWRVLAHAAEICRRPLADIEPQSFYQPHSQTQRPAVDWTPSAGVRPLPSGWLTATATQETAPIPISALGLSGHYLLPEQGFAMGIEAGVNLFFWEPNYETLTRFSSGIRPSVRDQLHFITGTFAADPAAVRADAERALRRLKRDRIDLFLLFWVRDWSRLTPETLHELEQLKEAGKIGMFGLSTHNRPLAVQAMDRGWCPIMVRHSAAHRGAETQILPQAVATGTSVIAFNCTCYGRLLRPALDSPAATAADCLRYSLSQPGITACLTAPATLPQLQENLSVLRDRNLPESRRQTLLKHGQIVYQHDKIFHEYIRK